MIKMAMCSSKKFSNERVNFSQRTPYPSPILPNYELTILTSLPLCLVILSWPVHMPYFSVKF